MNYESLHVDEGITLVQLKPGQDDRLFELTDGNREYLGEFLPWAPMYKLSMVQRST